MANFIYPHIALTVNNIEETKRFYISIGFRIKEDVYSSEKKRHFLLLEGYGFEMEVFHFDNQEKNQSDTENLMKTKIHHFALPVRSLIQLKEDLLKNKVELFKDISVSSLGLKFINVKDPTGFVIEFFETPKNESQ